MPHEKCQNYYRSPLRQFVEQCASVRHTEGSNQYEMHPTEHTTMSAWTCTIRTDARCHPATHLQRGVR